jgi:hypothetical protein
MKLTTKKLLLLLQKWSTQPCHCPQSIYFELYDLVLIFASIFLQVWLSIDYSMVIKMWHDQLSIQL